MSQTDSTISKLNAIEILYRRGYQSEVIDRAMDKLIALERHRAQQELSEVEKRLRIRSPLSPVVRGFSGPLSKGRDGRCCGFF